MKHPDSGAVDSAAVFLVGAGFSKAINERMPLMNELGTQVWDQLGERTPYLPPNLQSASHEMNLEQVLTYLVEDHPWDERYRGFERRAHFELLADRIVSTVTQAEAETTQTAPPDWLLHLVAYWSKTQSHVVTFNYDSLIESAYCATDENRYAANLQTAITTPLNLRTAGTVGADPDADAFKLSKLHGSTRWWYSGRTDSYGETIFDSLIDAKWPSRGGSPPAAADKVPVVVPPSFVKNPYLSNETVKHEWFNAWLALRRAPRVCIIGYSLPESDLLVRSLLLDGTRRGQQIEVVDVAPMPVVARVRSLLPTAKVVTCHEGVNAVNSFVELLVSAS